MTKGVGKIELDHSSVALPDLNGNHTGIELSVAMKAARGLKVFLSYSREDIDVADQLVPALEAFGHVVSIDREGIFGAERWEQRLGQLILEADTIVFLLTPSSAQSPRCKWEVDQSLVRNKRLVPVVVKQLAGVRPHEALRVLNYVYFCSDPAVPNAGWGSGLKCLHSALSVDIHWIREHTRVAEMSVRWLEEGSAEDLLARGSELTQLQEWRACRPPNAPELTPQQRSFLEASEHAEMLRRDRDRRQIEDMRAAQDAEAQALAARANALHLLMRRTKVGITVAAILSTGVMIAGGIAWRNWQAAEQALSRVNDEQMLQDRLIRLARNKELPSPPFSIDLLARRYEGESPDHIGTDFMGGVYYGTYRIKANANLEEFLAYCRRREPSIYGSLAAAGGKDAAVKRDTKFIEAWRALAHNNTTARTFAELQTDFVKIYAYRRLAARLKVGYPLQTGQQTQVKLDIDTRSLALRAVIFSVSVQYGPSTNLLRDALGELNSLTELSDEKIIKQIFIHRDKVDVYFPGLQAHSANYVEMIRERNHWEEIDAIQMLASEKG